MSLQVEIGQIGDQTIQQGSLKVDVGKRGEDYSDNSSSLKVNRGISQVTSSLTQEKPIKKDKSPRNKSNKLISIQTGQKYSLEALNNIELGMTWYNEKGLDIDLSIFMVNSSGVCLEEDLIFYNNPSNKNDSISLSEHDSYDKACCIELNAVPQNIERLAITLTLNKAQEKRHKFSMISNAILGIIDKGRTKEVIEYDFSELLAKQTALVIGEIYRHNGKWKIFAIGNGFNGGLAKLCENYGIEV